MLNYLNYRTQARVKKNDTNKEFAAHLSNEIWESVLNISGVD
jgi:hypothetical protein